MIDTLRGNAMLSRVPTRGMCGTLSVLGLGNVRGRVAVKVGLDDGCFNGGKVVGVRSGFFRSRRLGGLTLVTPGTAIGVVHSFGIIRGEGLIVPRRVRKVTGYHGPGYIAGRRPVGA